MTAQCRIKHRVTVGILFQQGEIAELAAEQQQQRQQPDLQIEQQLSQPMGSELTHLIGNQQQNECTTAP